MLDMLALEKSLMLKSQKQLVQMRKVIMSEHPKFPHRYINPKFDSTVLVAPGAHVIGDVEIGKESSIWFNAVIRGDVNFVRIGDRTNIQDCSLIHESYKTHPCIIGNDVTVGHSV